VDPVRCQQTSRSRDDCRLGLLDRRYEFMRLPAAAESLVKRSELLGCASLGADILLFKIEFFALGVEDVQIIRQAALPTKVVLPGQRTRR
jgi:hypothetical protein